MLLFVTKSVFYGSFVTQIVFGIARLRYYDGFRYSSGSEWLFFSTGQINGGFLPTANIL